MARKFLSIGSGLALLAVAAGAFGAHVLEDRLDQDHLDHFKTAAQYQMYHALALMVVAWVCVYRRSRTAIAAGGCFIAGIIIFAGTLYALALGGPKWLGAITPIGGILLMGGWLLLLISAMRWNDVNDRTR